MATTNHNKWLWFFSLSFLFVVGCFFYVENRIEESLIGLFENVSEKTGRKKDRETFGRKVYEISEAYFFKLKSELGENRKIQLSTIKKIDDRISIPTKRKQLTFKDIYRNDCMACVTVHEIIGENKEAEKLILETGYFRTQEYQIVDLETGNIDTLAGEPFFSENNKYLVTHDYNSKDTIEGGVNIYSLYERKIIPLTHRGVKWFPVEMFWRGDEDIFAKVRMIENINFGDENFRYIRIKI